MATAVGPPPGLTAHEKGTNRDTTKPSSAPTSSPLSPTAARKVSGGASGEDASTKPIPRLIKMCAPQSSRYETRFMLALSSSPLVAPPTSMPPLQQWYGDWEPYHFRAPHGSQSHGLPYSPMGSIGSGTRAERHGRGAGGAGGEYHRDKERNGEDADGYYGGVMRDGGLTSSRREQGGRFRNRYDEREADLGPLRVGDAGKRFPSSGKNPFGQVSASGTFKPAGKDGLEAGMDKRFGPGRRGEREMQSHAYLDDRSKGPRNGREGAGPRRRGQEEGDDDDEWESVPRSPEYERRNKSAGIDGAMEWRRTPGGKLGGKAAPLSARERERESGRKTSFPSWMTEETEPSWMNEGQDDGQQYQMGSHGGGARDGPSRKVDDHDEIEVDVTGMDGIQAFKAQMKERERRERERNQGGTSTSALSAGPPPGLQKRQQQDGDDHESKRDGAAALHSVGMGQATDKSSAALFDNFASSAKQRAQEKQQQAQMQEQRGGAPSSREEMESGGAAMGDQVQPSRSSRFARFFDGKPQAAALAAQQRQMEASQRGGTEESPAGSIHLPASPQGREGGSANLADLFKGMGTESKAGGADGKATSAAATPAPPGLQRNPSEADVQSMQKIMALLSGGGGGPPKGGQEESQGRSAPPGPPPSMPPGIGAGAGGGHSDEREKGGQQQSKQNPTTPLQHGPPPPPPPGGPGSWANAVASPRQQYDHHLGPYPTSPPPNSQQQQGGPPFRPPFGMDPRMLARGPPPPQGMLPQFGGAGMPPPPPMGRNFDMPPFPPGARPPPPMPPLPPQLQQHMMTLPPQAQHQLLMQHLQHHGLAHNAFGGPPPPPPPHHMTSPGQHHAGNGGASPLPPFMSPSPASSNAAQSAQLMALLGQGPGGSSSNNNNNNNNSGN